jgi:hypothetical protein
MQLMPALLLRQSATRYPPRWPWQATPCHSRHDTGAQAAPRKRQAKEKSARTPQVIGSPPPEFEAAAEWLNTCSLRKLLAARGPDGGVASAILDQADMLRQPAAPLGASTRLGNTRKRGPRERHVIMVVMMAHAGDASKSWDLQENTSHRGRDAQETQPRIVRTRRPRSSHHRLQSNGHNPLTGGAWSLVGTH